MELLRTPWSRCDEYEHPWLLAELRGKAFKNGAGWSGAGAGFVMLMYGLFFLTSFKRLFIMEGLKHAKYSFLVY